MWKSTIAIFTVMKATSRSRSRRERESKGDGASSCERAFSTERKSNAANCAIAAPVQLLYTERLGGNRESERERETATQACVIHDIYVCTCVWMHMRGVEVYVIVGVVPSCCRNHRNYNRNHDWTKAARAASQDLNWDLNIFTLYTRTWGRFWMNSTKELIKSNI